MIPGMDWPFNAIEGVWADPCYIVAGGPSAAAYNLESLEGQTVIAVNDSVFALPWATAVVSCDTRWVTERPAMLGDFQGEMIMGLRRWRDGYGSPVRRVTYIEAYDATMREAPISTNPVRVVAGGNSGYFALGVAFQKGCRDIRLIGFDMRHDGKTHNWHAGYPWKGASTPHTYNEWIAAYERAAPWLIAQGARVTNVSHDSALECFATDPYLVELKAAA